MSFLIIVVIALGWAGWIWAWFSQRSAANYGFFVSRGSWSGRWRSLLEMPRTPEMSRRRRRDLLIVLAVAALVTWRLASAWEMFVLVHIGVDLAFVAYGLAVLSIESASARPTPRPATSAVRASGLSLQPIVDGRTRRAPGPRRLAEQDGGRSLTYRR